MGRSLSVCRLSDKLHLCIARGFYLIPLSRSVAYPAIKIFGSDQALEPPSRNLQPGDGSDRPFLGIAADRKTFTASALFMSGSPEFLPSGLLGFPRPPRHPRQAGRGREGGKGDTENKRQCALNFSGSGNPEYAIHRVVEPEIDHN